MRGILLRYGEYDSFIAMSVYSFVRELTELGIDYDLEEEIGHCDPGWEDASLKYMSEKLIFEDE